MTTTTLAQENQITPPNENIHSLDLTPSAPQFNRAQRAAALYGAGRKYLRPNSDPVAGLIAERMADDSHRAEKRP